MIKINKNQLCYLADKNNKKSNIVFFMDEDRELNIDEEFVVRGKHKLKLIGFDEVFLMARA